MAGCVADNKFMTQYTGAAAMHRLQQILQLSKILNNVLYFLVKYIDITANMITINIYNYLCLRVDVNVITIISNYEFLSAKNQLIF